MLYETLVVVALLLAAGFVFFALVGGVRMIGGAPAAVEAGPGLRAALQLFLVAVLGAYFVGCWVRGGQTLPMKAWRLRVVACDGRPLGLRAATVRFALALVLIGPLAIGLGLAWRRGDPLLVAIALAPAVVDLAWSLVDRDGGFLHDRLSRTRVVTLDALPRG
jgi:uncharacterized RDD family membrane protein YckC